MSETIKVSRYTKESLLRVAANLQERTGRRIDFDEAIRHLLHTQNRKSKSLEKVFGSVPEIKLEELYEERKADERRASRRLHA